MTEKQAIEKLKTLYLEYSKIVKPLVPDYVRTYPTYFKHYKITNGLTNCILAYIRLHGWQGERINNIGVRKDNTKVVEDTIGRRRVIGSVEYRKSTMQRGTADISATINKNSVKIEIKNQYTKDTIKPHQLLYKQKVELAGGIHFFAFNFAEFVQWFDNKFNFAENYREKYLLYKELDIII